MEALRKTSPTNRHKPIKADRLRRSKVNKLFHQDGYGRTLVLEHNDINVVEKFAKAMVKCSKYPCYFTMVVVRPDNSETEYSR